MASAAHGRSEIEPLHLLAIPILQKTKLFGRFHTLGCYLVAEHTREIDDQLYDRRRFGAGSERRNELLRDLDLIDWKTPQVV